MAIVNSIITASSSGDSHFFAIDKWEGERRGAKSSFPPSFAPPAIFLEIRETSGYEAGTIRNQSNFVPWAIFAFKMAGGRHLGPGDEVGRGWNQSELRVKTGNWRQARENM